METTVFLDRESASNAGGITEWLEEVHSGNADTVECETEKPQKDLQDRQTYKNDPCTPLKQSRQVSPQYGEDSPISTNFSYDSIFDLPKSRPTSPNSPSLAVSRYGYATTEATSDSGEDEGERCAGKALGRLFTSKCTLSAEHAASIQFDEPPAGNNHESFHSEESDLTVSWNQRELQCILAPIEPHDSTLDTPRLVWITSCLQCTLANLPCSRTPPACSRCIRNGSGEVCLLYRRKMRSEMVTSDSARNMTPILLKIDDDDQTVLKTKTALAEGLLEVWLQDQDRKNWVLPVNNAISGSFKTCPPHNPQDHPGEGFGCATYHELRLAEA